MKILRMMSYTVFAVFGVGVLVVMLSLTVGDPLDGDDMESEGNALGSAYGTRVSGEESSGPSRFSTPRR